MRSGAAVAVVATSAALVVGLVGLVGVPRAAGPGGASTDTPQVEHRFADAVERNEVSPDAEQRLLVFSGEGVLPTAHAQALLGYAATIRTTGTRLRAEGCAASDDASGLRVLRALDRALAEADLPAWRWVAQPAGCSLPGSVVLRVDD